MKYTTRLMCGLAVLFAADSALSSPPTRVNTGPIHAATFDFVARAPIAEFAENNDAVHALLQEAITENLAAKGVARAADGEPDVKVAYLIVVGNNATTMAVNDYFGYGRDDTELAEKAHQAYTVDNKNPDYFEAGTLLIDILDAKTHELRLRTFVVRPIQAEITAEEQKARVKDAVSEALKDLSIAQ